VRQAGRFERFMKWTISTNKDLVIGAFILTGIAAIDLVIGTYRALVFDWSAEFSPAESIIPVMRLLAPLMGVVAVWGCVLCFRRRHIGLAIFTSIFGVIASYYVASFIAAIIGGSGIALVVFAKDEFRD
jgi:hypothetical protein